MGTSLLLGKPSRLRSRQSSPRNLRAVDIATNPRIYRWKFISDTLVGRFPSSAIGGIECRKTNGIGLCTPYQRFPAITERDRDTPAAATSAIPVVRIEPPRGWLDLRLAELWEYRELLYFFAWRDIKVRYKQTVIGVAWVILQPSSAA